MEAFYFSFVLGSYDSQIHNAAFWKGCIYIVFGSDVNIFAVEEVFSDSHYGSGFLEAGFDFYFLI